MCSGCQPSCDDGVRVFSDGSLRRLPCLLTLSLLLLLLLSLIVVFVYFVVFVYVVAVVAVVAAGCYFCRCLVLFANDS